MAIVEKKRLGDILVEAGKITPYQLAQALKVQKSVGKKLGEVLIELNIITENEIIDAVEKQTGIEKVNLNELEFDRKVINMIPQTLCEKYVLIPFGLNGAKIQVALSDPLNIFATDDISISTGFEVESYISNKADITKFIHVHYSSEEVNRAAAELSREKLTQKNAMEKAVTAEDVKNAPVVKMVEFLFKNSVEMRASDIHIEPFENEVRIRYRIDGELQTVNTLQIESLAALVTRIKILADLNIAEKRIPQDGRIITKVGNYDIDLRVSILPVVSGEKIVIRILNRSNFKVGKERLGLSEKNMDKLLRIISNPHGIVLVTGPTGSGKSTTLYTLLSELNQPDINIVTIEDPVEFVLDGVNQVNVNTKSGLTFASGLRSILRQDPDIVMIGEIRDEETAQIAVRAAITGHLVLSTLHTNDAPSTITRLVDMGIEPYLLSTSITGVVAQRLVRRICDHCKTAYEASDYEKRIMNV
ncbi:MAG: GspE/PulE family protein, partial [Turicibacter sp.]